MALPIKLDYVNAGSGLSRSALANIPDPPGFSRKSTHGSRGSKAIIDSRASSAPRPDLNTLRQKRAWDTAFSPAKSIPMQGFMMWMAGNSVQIFSMMSIFNCVKTSISGIVNVNRTFAPLVVQPLPNAAASSAGGPPSDSLLPQKGAYVICQAILLGLALYKCHTMGLLPTSPSDWLAFKPPPLASEYVGFPAFG